MNSTSLSNVQEARTVLWPFREFKGQTIGSLLDNGSIQLKDLGFAVERAYDKRVRDASKILLLYALTQEKSLESKQVGPLNVFSSERRSFSERRQIQFALLEGFVSGIVMGGLLFVLGYVLFARNEASADAEQNVLSALTISQTIIVIGIAATILIGIPVSILWFVDRITSWTDRQIKLHRIGQRGEERVLDAMYHSLDGEWWLFRNLDLPGQKLGDIDLILIGSGGVWVLEVKSYQGEFRVVGQRWERRIGNYWLPAFKNPSRQAKRNAAALSHLLGTKNIKQWITPVIVWANPDSKLTIENPDVHIWQLNQIANTLNELKNKSQISEEQKAKLVEIFKNLYKEPFQLDSS